MKKLKLNLHLLPVLFIFVFASCGVNSALQVNHNTTVTNVTLSNANFKVTSRVMGTASQEYIMCIGAIDKTSLYANAKADLMQKANLVGSAKALINIIAEEHVGGVPPFYFKRTVTYTADIIEFIK